MKAFRRDGDVYVAKLSPFEVELLFSLLGQLDEIIGIGLSPDDDPIAVLMHAAETEPLDRTDPLVARLFPNAYMGDDEASSDFARFTEYEQRAQLARDFAIVTGALAGTEDGANDLRVFEDEAPSWLRTLSALRLSLATRLDIVNEESLERLETLGDDDPDAFGYEIYEWLGFVMETLLRVVA